MLPLLKEMFKEMVVKKDISKVPHYYHQDFLLYTNGQVWNYATFLKSHEEIYESSIQYKILFDKETLVSYGDKVAGRVYITVQKDPDPPKEIEVILIAQYKGKKLYRIWELTFPDWQKEPSFEKLSSH